VPASSRTASISGRDIGSTFGKDGDAVVILLGGGTKKRQDRDIAIAQERWADYKKRRAEK
jgi:putative component of toxin-antitoxin plasmid stabilization module